MAAQGLRFDLGERRGLLQDRRPDHRLAEVDEAAGEIEVAQIVRGQAEAAADRLREARRALAVTGHGQQAALEAVDQPQRHGDVAFADALQAVGHAALQLAHRRRQFAELAFVVDGPARACPFAGGQPQQRAGRRAHAGRPVAGADHGADDEGEPDQQREAGGREVEAAVALGQRTMHAHLAERLADAADRRRGLAQHRLVRRRQHALQRTVDRQQAEALLAEHERGVDDDLALGVEHEHAAVGGVAHHGGHRRQPQQVAGGEMDAAAVGERLRQLALARRRIGLAGFVAPLGAEQTEEHREARCRHRQRDSDALRQAATAATRMERLAHGLWLSTRSGAACGGRSARVAVRDAAARAVGATALAVT